jgi:acetylornithine deacetylase/succinyl-diaminopimelate desuccinylase-like protein
MKCLALAVVLLGLTCTACGGLREAPRAPERAAPPMFMSPEHVALANARLATAQDVRRETAKLDRDYRIAYALSDGPGGATVHWQMGFDRGGTAWLALGAPATPADVTIRSDYRAMVLASKAAREGRRVPDPSTKEGDTTILQRIAPALAAARAAATVDVTFPEFAQVQAARAIAITTDAAFSVASIPAYAGQHDDVYAYIDRHQAQHLEKVQQWLRQPSVSAQNEGIQPMAQLVRKDLAALGCQESELVPTSGHPAVWAHCDYGAKETLLIYMMYDVQPVEPADWKSPPFAAKVVDHELGKAVMARGATNQKGPQRAFLNALEAIRAVKGKLPVNLMFAAEGEEELGSPHYPEVIAKYESRLRQASGVLFPFNSQDPQGNVSMFLGVKGIVYMELEARGGAHGGPSVAEIHGSYKAIVDAPALRLVQALATLTSADGNTITVPGYYDAIRPPNDEEQRLLNGLLPGWAEREPVIQKAFGVQRWIDGWQGRETQLQLLFNTTLNIDGLVAGYTGEGMKTILPHRAIAKIDSRLVPNQDPDAQMALIRRHLDAQGFTDIELRKLSGYPPAQTSVEAPLVRATIGVFAKRGLVPTVSPRIAGSAPYYLFTDRLKLPMIAAGLGYGTGAHAPNELMVIEPKAGSKIGGLAEQEKFYVDLIHAVATVD